MALVQLTKWAERGVPGPRDGTQARNGSSEVLLGRASWWHHPQWRSRAGQTAVPMAPYPMEPGDFKCHKKHYITPKFGYIARVGNVYVAI